LGQCASQASEVPESVATENVATADAARNASEVSDANNAAAAANAPTEETSSSGEQLTSAPALEVEFAKLKDKMLFTWLSDVERALATNEVSLAILPIDDVLGSTGKLAHL
jgi:hypothetical protein